MRHICLFLVVLASCAGTAHCEGRFYGTTRDPDGRWWFVDPGGRRFFLAELRGIANRGKRELPVDAAFFRLLPRIRDGVKVARGDADLEPPKEGQPTPIPPQLWRPWWAAAWELPDGTFLGLVAQQRTGVDVKFWKDRRLHSDAWVRLRRSDIRPGDTLYVSKKPFVAGACRRSDDEWRDVRAALAECVK